MIDPGVLLDLGFQLSFLSLIGVLYLGPFIVEKFKIEDYGFLNWKQNAITTISAQLLVAPLIMANFGSISFTGFLANIAILEFVPPTMLCGFILGLGGIIFGTLGWLLGIFVQLIMAYHLGVISLFAQLQLPVSSWWWVVALYAVLTFILFRNTKIRYG